MDTSPLDVFVKDIPSGWSYQKDSDKLSITKDSMVSIQYCDLSPMFHEPVKKFSYTITIDFTKKLTPKEIKRRTFLQDSILNAYKEEYKKKSDKFNYGRVEFFQYKKNSIDTLRIPFYSDSKHSFFIQDNFPWGHCIVSHEQNEMVNFYSKLKDRN